MISKSILLFLRLMVLRRLWFMLLFQLFLVLLLFLLLLQIEH